jgi:hypothetical protein
MLADISILLFLLQRFPVVWLVRLIYLLSNRLAGNQVGWMPFFYFPSVCKVGYIYIYIRTYIWKIAFGYTYLCKVYHVLHFFLSFGRQGLFS